MEFEHKAGYCYVLKEICGHKTTTKIQINPKMMVMMMESVFIKLENITIRTLAN